MSSSYKAGITIMSIIIIAALIAIGVLVYKYVELSEQRNSIPTILEDVNNNGIRENRNTGLIGRTENLRENAGTFRDLTSQLRGRFS